MAFAVHLESNDILLQEGEQSHSMYLLQKGTLVVSRLEDGKEVVLGHIRAGELVGELSFLDQKPRSATVRAISPCELTQIPLRTMEAFFKSQPVWMEVFIRNLVTRIREADARIRI